MQLSVLSGTGSASFDLPSGWQAEVVRPPTRSALPCQLPSDFPQVGGARRVLLVVPDLTRPGPEAQLLPPLVERLRSQGVEQVEGLIATGLHRPMTSQEILARYGPVDLIWHNHEPGEAVSLGTVEGVPVSLNPRLLEADLILTLGLVEPHQYAGFSGGYKTVAIGCAGEPTIGATHAPSFLRRPGVGLGKLEGNPFQAVLQGVAQRLGRPWQALNYVLDDAEALLGVHSGEPGEVLRRLSQEFHGYFFQVVEGAYQVAVVGCPAPKSDNLYQATRAASYLALLDACPLEPGGTLIMVAPCPEGGGQGTGEKRFLELLERGVEPSLLAAELESRPVRGGEQRAWVVARMLERFRVVLAGSTLECDWLARAGLGAAPDLAQAVQVQERHCQTARCLVVTDPFRCLPVTQRSPFSVGEA